MRKKRIAIWLLLSLLIGLPGRSAGRVLQAESVCDLTMTEVHDGRLRTADLAGKRVGISSAEELSYLDDYLEDNNSGDGVEFVLTEDIAVTAYTFSYDETSNRVGIYWEGNLEAAFSASDMCYYKDFSSKERVRYTPRTDSFTMIGDQFTTFKGILDGRGHSIQGIWMRPSEVSDEEHADFVFDYIGNTGQIKNIRFSDVYVQASTMLSVGILVRNNAGSIENCQVEAIAVGNFFDISGICNYNSGTIRDCSVDVNFSEVSIGVNGNGIASQQSSGLITACVASGRINGGGGGILGCLSGGRIQDCMSRIRRRDGSASFYGAGGIVAEIDQVGKEDKRVIVNCTNAGDIFLKKDTNINAKSVGGIVGSTSISLNKCIYGCVNLGSISSSRPCGGIVGESDSHLEISNCANEGDIKGLESKWQNSANACAGGILGSGESVLYNNYNTGKVSAERGNAGGIAGSAQGVCLAENNYNRGQVSGSAVCGELAGDLTDGQFRYNYYPSDAENPAFGFKAGGQESENYPVTEAQMLGTETGTVIAEKGYGAEYTLQAALNRWRGNELGEKRYTAEDVTEEDYFYPWKDGVDGPVHEREIPTAKPTVTPETVVTTGPDVTSAAPEQSPTVTPTETPAVSPEKSSIPAPPVETPAPPVESPTASPVETLAPPEESPTVKPVGTSAPPEKSPTASPVETPVPPEKSPTVKPVGTSAPPEKSPTAGPVETPAPPEKSPTVKPVRTSAPPEKSPTAPPVKTLAPPVESPTAGPVETQAPLVQSPTVKPVETSVPSEKSITAEPVETPAPPPVKSPAVGPVKTVPGAVRTFTVKGKRTGVVKLKWSAVKGADGYLIFRSGKGDRKYKQLARVSPATVKWTDRKAKAGMLYHYKICAYRGKKPDRRTGEFQTARVRVLWPAPNFTVKKKKTDTGVRYLRIKLKKTSGKFVDIWVRSGKKKFVRLKVNRPGIRKNHGVFNLKYSRRRAALKIKIRTYNKKKGRQYSYFSETKKVRIA